MWLWLVTAALAQSLDALDAAPPPAPVALAWDDAPGPRMVRTGGNGPGRVQYVVPGDPRAFGRARADAVTYEYVDGHLATVIAVLRTAYDADAVGADLEAAYGPPTYAGEEGALRVWRGRAVRVVWRRQTDDLWVVTWSWLARHGGGEEPALGPASEAADPALIKN